MRRSTFHAVEKALEILASWNQAGMINRVIRLNRPQVWQGMDGGAQWNGQRMLIEPYIDNYIKFNSNTGWTLADGSAWSKVMQALSHYSYHLSGGQFVLCDLQGGIFKDGAILSDPVVHSRAHDFGLTEGHQHLL